MDAEPGREEVEREVDYSELIGEFLNQIDFEQTVRESLSSRREILAPSLRWLRLMVAQGRESMYRVTSDAVRSRADLC